MAEHLELNGTAGRSTDALASHGFGDGLDLLEPQLPGQDDHVGELAVEAQALDVGDAQLRRDVHFEPEPARFGDGGHVGSDDGADAGVACSAQRLAHRRQVFVIECDVERQIAAEPVFPAQVADGLQVFRRKVVGRMGTHVEPADAEIDGIRPALDGGVQAFEIACGRHNFQPFIFHDG